MTRPRRCTPRASRAGAIALVAALAGAMVGCDSTRKAIPRGPVPEYGSVVEPFNERLDRLDRVWARAAVQIRWGDEDGQRRWEQGEGHLAMLRPDRVALSIGKLGETLFWLGCDGQRYWWIDLTGDRKHASVGRHDGPARRGLSAGPEFGRLGGLAASISPLDLFDLVPLVPLATDQGTTQWSDDGHLLGLTAPWRGGRKRVWVNPETYEPVKVELYDEAGEAVLVADLSEPDLMSLTGTSDIGPSIAQRVFVGHAATDTELRLYLSGFEDDPKRFSPDAFDFEKLLARLGVQDVVDLDRAGPAGGGR
jgi:hypothetical protein